MEIEVIDSVWTENHGIATKRAVVRFEPAEYLSSVRDQLVAAEDAVGACVLDIDGSEALFELYG